MTPPRSPAARRLDLARDGVVSVAEAMAFLGLGETKVYDLMARGQIASAKLGRRRVVLKRSLVEYVAENVTAD